MIEEEAMNSSEVRKKERKISHDIIFKKSLREI